MLLAIWSAPIDEDVDTINVYRSTAAAGPWGLVVSLASRDGYGNWITHYEDDGAPPAAYYRAEFLKNGLVVEASRARAGEVPYAVTPQMVSDQMQGIDLLRVSATMAQRMIKWAVEVTQRRIRMNLSSTTAIKEAYGPEVYRQILGAKAGTKIQLRHWPVIAVDKVYYRIRSALQATQDNELTNLDILIENHDAASGYNHGQVSLWPRATSMSALFAGLTLTSHFHQYAVAILFSYRHGWTSWPPAIEELITELATAALMEVAGEAGTAGLSSRSVDGYAETYTASATTTVFSARRIWYEQHVKEITKLYKKPLWA